MLGHGAGGGPDAPDLVALARALPGERWAVARTEQPYRVAGRRMPVPAQALDEAFGALVTVAVDRLPGIPLVTGGRSSGGRVAARTADATGAAGVLALAFPLHPPRRPDRSRLPELLGCPAPVLVVQGERDPFGAPAEFPPIPGVRLVAVPGGHDLAAAPAGDLAGRVLGWLAGLGRPGE